MPTLKKERHYAKDHLKADYDAVILLLKNQQRAAEDKLRVDCDREIARVRGLYATLVGPENYVKNGGTEAI